MDETIPLNPDDDRWRELLWQEALDGVRAAMMLAGDNPDRDGVQDTPRRWVKALIEQSVGLKQDPVALLGTTFDVPYDELVVVRDVPFTSLCEHHLLPFAGTATIGYMPSDRVVGLSKLPRLLHGYARRPQVQERLTVQIADAIETALAPRGVGVRLSGHHSCMSCRGVRSLGSMVTQALRGTLRDDSQQRAEFLALANGH